MKELPLGRGPLHGVSTEREKPYLQSPLHPSLTVTGRRVLLQIPPKRGPYGKRCQFPEPFLHILQSPQQGSPPSRFPSQSSQRERHYISRAPFNHIPKSPVDEPSSRFPKLGPYGKRCQSPQPLHILQGPQQGSPPSRFPSHSSHRERHHSSRVPFNHISKSPIDKSTPGCQTEPP